MPQAEEYSEQVRKILILSPSDIFPPVDGNSENIYHIIKYLAPKNVLGVLLSHVFSQGGTVDLFHPHLTIRYCPPTIFDRLQYKSFLLNPHYFKAAHDLMQDLKADIIQCQVLYTIFVGYSLKKRFHKPLVLVQENAEYIKQVKFQAPAYVTYVLRWMEHMACNVADKIVAVSEADKKHMMELYNIPAQKIHVIEHCADAETFKYDADSGKKVREALGISDQDMVLTYVGKMDAPHNTVATQHIAERIYPVVSSRYPNSTFMIVGQNYEHLLKYRKERIFFTGFVTSRRDASPNLADYLSASDIVIVPMDRGSGTRLKILEAAACSRPIVSTEVGAEGLDFVNDKEILLCDRIDEGFTQLVLSLLEDEARREELGRRARQKVLSRYSWEREVAKFEGVYREIEDRRAATSFGQRA